MDLLELLLDYDHWATAQLLEASRGLTDRQLDQPFDIGRQTLRKTFGHMIFNVPFWTAFLAGKPADEGFSADAQPDDRSLTALIDHRERSYAAFAAVSRQLRDEQRLGEIYADHYDVRKSCGGTILMVIETRWSTAPRCSTSSNASAYPTSPKSTSASGSTCC